MRTLLRTVLSVAILAGCIADADPHSSELESLKDESDGADSIGEDVEADYSVVDSPVDESDLPADAIPLLEALFARLEITEGSSVHLLGPVLRSSRLGRLDPSIDEAIGPELVIPKALGTYYAVMIDPTPNAYFGHAVRYAWLRAEDGSVGAMDAEFRMGVRYRGLLDTFVPRGEGEFLGATVRVADRSGVSIPNQPPLPLPPDFREWADLDPASWAPRAPADQCMQYALVTDFGDIQEVAGFENITGQADAFAGTAFFMEEYLRKLGFGQIVRAGQRFGPGFANAGELESAIQSIIVQAAAQPAPDNCCHDVFLYLVGHGTRQNGWGALLFDPDQSGTNTAFSLTLALVQTLYALRDSGDDLQCIRLWIQTDSCHDGALVANADFRKVMKDLCDLGSDRCGIEVRTATTAERTTPADLLFTVTAALREEGARWTPPPNPDWATVYRADWGRVQDRVETWADEDSVIRSGVQATYGDPQLLTCGDL